MILYIGNILSSSGMNPPPVELIRNEIYKSSKIKMITASNKKNRILRFLHMNYVYWGNYKRVSLMFIDVYSTKAFYFTFYFALISKILSLKYIPIIHGGNIEERIKRSKWMTKFIFKNADLNISPSKYIYNISRKKSCSIKELIMNQKIIVGIGNIYATEALFLSKIHPAMKASNLSLRKASKLVTNIKSVLQESIEMGGTTIKDYVNAEGQPGYFVQKLLIYQKKFCPIHKKHKVCNIKISGRSSFFCSKCQIE